MTGDPETMRLRTVDEVAVQSQGERRIGDWLAAKGIACRYDERVTIVGGLKRLISLNYRDFDHLEQLLEEKLSRYVPSH